MTDGRHGAGPHRASRPAVGRLVRILVTITVVGIVALLALPHVPEAVDTFAGLGGGSPALAAAAIVAEAGSLFLYSRLTIALLGRDSPGFAVVVGVDVSALGLRSVLPGGAAASGSLRLRTLTRAGVPAARATTVILVQAGVVAVTLCLLFAAGVFLSAGPLDADGWVAVGAGVSGAVVVATAVLAWVCVRHLSRFERAAVRVTAPLRRWSARFDASTVSAFVHTLGAGVRDLVDDPGAAIAAVSLSFGNWILDAAALWLIGIAVGARPGVGVLVVVYALGNVLAMLPLTPGGIGITETAMVSTLVLTGVHSGPALLAVLGWRVVEYWLPVVVAAVAYPVLTVGLRRRARRRTSSAPAVSAVGQQARPPGAQR